MNQRARHAFVSITLEPSAPFAVVGARGTRTAGREGGRGRENEANHQGQRLRCPFWPLLESDPRRLDISSDSYESPVKAQILRDAADSEGEEKKWRRVTEIVSLLAVNPFDSDRAFPRFPRGEDGTQKESRIAGTIYAFRSDGSRSKFAKPACHSCEINCPVELGRDSN